MAPVAVPGAGAPDTGGTGGGLSTNPLNALHAFGVFAAAGATGLHLRRRRTGRH
jgi:hypothetical protein